jgi:hypothetical protein
MLPTLATASPKPFLNAACRSIDKSLLPVRTEPFARFGCWAPSISVARDGTMTRLARWIALNQRVSAADGKRLIRASADQLWRRCQEANPQCFRTYRVVTLDRPSYFLPAGDVVFEVLENPTQIPEQPPTGVMLRHLEAMDMFPSATFYFLRPVFVTEPTFGLCSADELRGEAQFNRLDAMRLARYFGWAFRTQAWLALKRDAAALFALRALVRAVEALTWDVALRRVGDRIDPRTRRLLRRDFERRLQRTESLGLAAESRRLESALAELRRRIAIDPVLAFEVPDRAGQLWFEAHWFFASNGRTYVHY